MKTQSGRLTAIPVLCLFVLTLVSGAMNMPSYDVHSLVFMSTDIVVANLSEDAQHNFTAVVTEPLYGSIQPNDRLETLTAFLTYFKPMEDGMRVILFMDRRPHTYDFLHSDAAKSPFAVPPSGVYLIDAYDHVHTYFQEMNPGPYVARGYSYIPKKTEPTKEQDLALPPLEVVKSQIAAAIKDVEPARTLLDKAPVPADAPALLHLVDTTSESAKDCDLRMASGIREQALERIRSLNDPALLLEAYAVSGVSNSAIYAIEFIRRPGTGDDLSMFTASRVQYLIHALADRQQDDAARAAAVRILLNVGSFHNGPHPGPSKVLPLDKDNELASSLTQIQALSKAIFDRRSESAQLRGLCLQFLDLNQPDILAEVKHIYRHTSSSELRFAIEKTLLDVSDSLYASLNPPGGPVASRVARASECGCDRSGEGRAVFLMQYQERKDFQVDKPDFIFPKPALTNLTTRQHLVFEDYRELWGWKSEYDGEFAFDLASLPGVSAGDYSLAVEYERGGKILSKGYALKVTVKDTLGGKQIAVLSEK
jgi:hypothetical protein